MNGWRTAASVLVISVVISAGLATATAVSGSAATACMTSWTSAHDGSWNDAANWTHGVPDRGADACITLPGTYTVTVEGGDNDAHSLSLGATDGTQDLALTGTCSAESVLSLDGDSSVGINGVVTLGSTGCSGAELSNIGSTLTNNGEIDVQPGSFSYFSGDVQNNAFVNVNGDGQVAGGTWTNAGTISVANFTNLDFPYGTTLVNNGSVDAVGEGAITFSSGTYVQGSGRLLGPAPVIVDYGHVTYAGRGAGTVTIRSYEASISGDIGRHQTLRIGICGYGDAGIVADANWINRGTIVLNSACYTNIELSGLSTLTNFGTINAIGDGSFGYATIDGRIVNHGVLSVGAGAVLQSFGPRFVNAADGTLGVALASDQSFARIFMYFGSQFVGEGTLAISTLGTYWPRSGRTFAIVDNAQSRVGRFATVTGLTKPGQTVALHIHYYGGEILLSAS